MFARNGDISNKTGGPFYERLQDNEVRKHGGFYSKETNVANGSAEKNESLGYVDKYGNKYTIRSEWRWNLLGNKLHEQLKYFVDRIYRERFVRHLHKRETVDPRKTTCMLYLQADHQFFARYGTEEACIEVMTRHVQRVNSIYKHTGESNYLPACLFSTWPFLFFPIIIINDKSFLSFY